MPSLGRSRSAQLLAAVSAVGLLLTPAIAAPAKGKKAPAVSVSFDPLSTFTPSGADAKLAASIGNRGLSLTDFKFTPAAAKSRPSQVRVAIRARPDTAPTRTADATSASPVTALTPASYNLGAAVGWRRFAVSGDVAKSKSPDPAIGGRESAVLGVSYSLNNKLSTRVAVGAERNSNPVAALRRGDNMSVDAGASYNLSRRIALTGGVRYNIERDRTSAFQDDRRDSQAVYVGTAFKF